MSIVKDLLFIFLILFSTIYSYYQYKKRIDEKEYFIKTLSHDLRVSAIAQIRGLELLKKNIQNPDFQNELINNINDSCEFSLDMITTLINTYRYERKERVLEYRYFSFNNFIFEIVQKINKIALEKDIRFNYDFDNSIFFEADYYALSKAFMGVLTTTLIYADAHSNVKIKAKKTNSFLEIGIIYKGKPLTEEETRRMFSQNPKFSIVGQGIKMYFCKKIIDFHKGSIKVYNHLSNINSFLIKLPLNNKKNSLEACSNVALRAINN